MLSFFKTSPSLLIVSCVLSLTLAGCSKKSPQGLYGANCGICHHGGDGMPGSVPPLTDRIDVIAKTAEGRHYLADVLINGVSGPIMADGKPYNAYMPSFLYLKDEEIAEILTWLSSRGSTQPAPKITAEDVAAARAHRISAGKVAAERAELNKKFLIP